MATEVIIFPGVRREPRSTETASNHVPPTYAEFAVRRSQKTPGGYKVVISYVLTAKDVSTELEYPGDAGKLFAALVREAHGKEVVLHNLRGVPNSYFGLPPEKDWQL